MSPCIHNIGDCSLILCHLTWSKRFWLVKHCVWIVVANERVYNICKTLQRSSKYIRQVIGLRVRNKIFEDIYDGKYECLGIIVVIITVWIPWLTLNVNNSDVDIYTRETFFDCWAGCVVFDQRMVGLGPVYNTLSCSNKISNIMLVLKNVSFVHINWRWFLFHLPAFLFHPLDFLFCP
jgi:hypothetical protein